MPCFSEQPRGRLRTILIVTAVVVSAVLVIVLPIVLTNKDDRSTSASGVAAESSSSWGEGSSPDQQQGLGLEPGSSLPPTPTPTSKPTPTPPPTPRPSALPTASPTSPPSTRTPTTSPTIDQTSSSPTLTPAAAPTAVPVASSTTVAKPSLGTWEPNNGEWTAHQLTPSRVIYYHCGWNQDAAAGTDVVLLHGASFSKENWRRKGILDSLCKDVTVAALDLPRSNSVMLKETLDQMQAAGLVRLPVTLVTPSASGYSIVSWVRGGSGPDLEDLPTYVSTWVPVAPGSVSMLTDEEVKSLSQPFVSILAIHGDRDNNGGDVSDRLGDLAGAKVVELEGGHAVYLTSSKEFTEEILDYIL